MTRVDAFHLTRVRGFLAIAIAITVAGCGGSDGNEVSDRQAATPTPTPVKPLSAEQIADQVGPSTVKLFGRFGESVTSGSGAVIDAEQGLVLTNAHVVSGVEALKVQITDTQTAVAQVLAQAPCEDVALVKIVSPPPDLKAVSLGTSARVKSGQPVSVLGYPSSLEGTDTGSSSKLTITNGTVSNPQTSAELGPSSPRYESLIQHQAPVNHGNSGGPLVDQFGQLIGLNTLTGAGSDKGNQTQGQYYAISVDRIKGMLSDLEQGRDLNDYGWTLHPVSSDLFTDYYGDEGADLADAVVRFLEAAEETEGLMVLNTDPGSSAERNHFVVGDYITAINDTPVTSVADVCEIVAAKSPGDTLKVTGRLLSSNTPSEDFGDEFNESLRVPRGDR